LQKAFIFLISGRAVAGYTISIACGRSPLREEGGVTVACVMHDSADRRIQKVNLCKVVIIWLVYDQR
jgi:hypothetical protein